MAKKLMALKNLEVEIAGVETEDEKLNELNGEIRSEFAKVKAKLEKNEQDLKENKNRKKFLFKKRQEGLKSLDKETIQVTESWQIKFLEKEKSNFKARLVTDDYFMYSQARKRKLPIDFEQVDELLEGEGVDELLEKEGVDEVEETAAAEKKARIIKAATEKERENAEEVAESEDSDKGLEYVYEDSVPTSPVQKDSVPIVAQVQKDSATVEAPVQKDSVPIREEQRLISHPAKKPAKKNASRVKNVKGMKFRGRAC